MTPEQIAAKLTQALAWTLGMMRKHPDMTMAEIGEKMRMRPGARKPIGRYARDRQGLGMVGSLILGRLEKLGLAYRAFENEHHTGRLTPLGRAVLAVLDKGVGG
jgi:hypothetical protein